jgi:hypothetical protein
MVLGIKSLSSPTTHIPDVGWIPTGPQVNLRIGKSTPGSILQSLLIPNYRSRGYASLTRSPLVLKGPWCCKHMSTFLTILTTLYAIAGGKMSCTSKPMKYGLESFDLFLPWCSYHLADFKVTVPCPFVTGSAK